MSGVGPVDLGQGDPVDPEEFLAVPTFGGLSKSILKKNAGAVVKRRFKAGEIICREGEFGSTAFYILEGSADVFLSAPMGKVQSEGRVRRFVRRIKSLLTGVNAEGSQADQLISIDAPVSLTVKKPTARLNEGDLFGEMTCLSRYPRSATVRAAEDCVVFEMLSNILSQLMRTPEFKDWANQVYRQRALGTYLRSQAMFEPLSDEELDFLMEKAELIQYSPGETIFSQGDAADSLYLVRIGFVRVSQNVSGGEVVLSYLPKGSLFGEMGILHGTERVATCAALDHVEVVRFGAEVFVDLSKRHEEIRARVAGLAAAREMENARRLTVAQSVPLDSFLDQGLTEAQSLLLLDLDSCTRCDDCVRACASTHDGVTRLIRDGLRFDKYLVATSCRTCADPVCLIGCPVGSIRRKSTLEIVIEDWCIGCGLCAKNCPYGNINMHPFEVLQDDAANPGRQKAMTKKKATTCDLCSDHEEPACVSACPHDAAMRVNPMEFFENDLAVLARGSAGEEEDPAPE